MSQALLVIQFLNAALLAGVSMYPLLKQVSDLIIQRNAEGGTVTAEDLAGLLNDGDEKEAAARKQFEDTLADPNTPKLQ